MTYKQLRDKLRLYGFRLEHIDTSTQRGYVSRKNFQFDNQDIHFVPETSKKRRGQAYFLVPRYDSTRYCYRYYLNVSRETVERLGIL